MSTPPVLEVLVTGPLTTVQDLGRPGYAALGVGRSGAADRAALRLGNRLVGNDESAAGLEVTFGGLVLRATSPVVLAVTGAPAPLCVGRTPGPFCAAVHVPAGTEVRLGTPACGLRTYVAVRGGIDVTPVLGSRSSDLLSGLGPDRLAVGDLLPVGAPPAAPVAAADVAAASAPSPGDLRLRAVPGPRLDWFTDTAAAVLTGTRWLASSDSDRVGLRLTGARIERNREGELPSEGMVAGALQVPPSGEPVLFLADHPTTGGYPVVAVLRAADVDRAAQLRPGQGLRITLTG